MLQKKWSISKSARFRLPKMFDGRLKVTICGAKDLQHTKLTERFDEWQLTKAKTKEVTSLEPYVAIDVDEVAVERTSTKQKTKARKTNGGRTPAVDSASRAM